MFKIKQKSTKSQARLTTLQLKHGEISGPFFMPIATRAAVKTMTAAEMSALGAQVLLGNTYHLYLRPGMEVVKEADGLHKFMNWTGPILTDSGGYQIFSLAKKRKMTEQGAEFADEITGTKHLLTPEKSIEIQHDLGSDMVMVLDECVASPAEQTYLEKSVDLTTRWAQRSKDEFEKRNIKKEKGKRNDALFAIVQGELDQKLRLKSARDLVKIGFDGYAVGGLAVGEPSEKMHEVLDYTVPALPEDKPHYLMGVGQPEEIIEAVKRGIDMFDCVLPTRNARHGTLYVYQETKPQNQDDQFGFNYKTIRIKNSQFRTDFDPVDNECPCTSCQNNTRAYLRHLFMTSEPLAQRLATIHNLTFYLRLMKKIRWAIMAGFL